MHVDRTARCEASSTGWNSVLIYGGTSEIRECFFKAVGPDRVGFKSLKGGEKGPLLSKMVASKLGKPTLRQYIYI